MQSPEQRTVSRRHRSSCLQLNATIRGGLQIPRSNSDGHLILKSLMSLLLNLKGPKVQATFASRPCCFTATVQTLLQKCSQTEIIMLSSATAAAFWWFFSLHTKCLDGHRTWSRDNKVSQLCSFCLEEEHANVKRFFASTARVAYYC